ncbi:hypothetical protein ACOME3_002001 [Neoechinorhynchus agilis]
MTRSAKKRMDEHEKQRRQGEESLGVDAEKQDENVEDQVEEKVEEQVEDHDSEVIISRKKCKRLIVSSDSEQKADADYEEEEEVVQAAEETGEEEDTRMEWTRDPYVLRTRPKDTRVRYDVDMQVSELERSIARSRRRRANIACIDMLYPSETSDEEDTRLEQVDERQQDHNGGQYIRVSHLKRPVVENEAEQRALMMFKNVSHSKAPQAMVVMKNVGFDSVGGHNEKIKALKEMILLPLMYPDFFESREIKPPRGVLFHGVPGTGKTLLAQALSSECSSGPVRVSFISHKATDFLSKWFGESEKGLRELFEKARAMAPCIVYLDEIDGLVPSRSTAEEGSKVHNTIVTTLLGLMDGLGTVAGGIVVIGSTNRVDAIDPALRRPGRFDREFFFGLPNAQAREEIIAIHTRKWKPVPDRSINVEMALHTKGFSGADLQALCREAIVSRMRRKFPQLYHSKQRLAIENEDVEVTRQDFIEALDKVCPASMRSRRGFAVFPLPREIAPLLNNHRDEMCDFLNLHYRTMLSKDGQQPFVSGHDFGIYCPRLVVFESQDCGYNSFVVPSVLHHLELPTHCIDIRHIHDPCFSSVEQAVAMILERAQREAPSAILMPRINVWWETLEAPARLAIESVISSIPSTRRVLIMATATCKSTECPVYLRRLFPLPRQEFNARSPSKEEIHSFFRYLLTDQALVYRYEPWASEDDCKSIEHIEKPKLTKEEEDRLWEREEATVRAFRIAARRVVSQLCRDRQFCAFREAVRPMSVRDYYNVIRHPMDLSVILSKIDRHQYFRFQEVFDDLRRIHSNAIRYNPDGRVVDRQRRQRASLLLDVVNSIFQNQIREEVEADLTQIFEERKRRGSIVEMRARCSIFSQRVPSRNINGDYVVVRTHRPTAAFVRYDPVVPHGVHLRSNNGMEGALDRDNCSYRRILELTEDETCATLWIEVHPQEETTLVNGTMRGSKESSDELTIPATNVECTNQPDNKSVAPELFQRAEDLSNRATEVAQQKLKSFQDLQIFSARMYAIIRDHAYNEDKSSALDELEEEIKKLE